MHELQPKKLSLAEIQERRTTTKFPAKLRLNDEIYKTEVLVQSLGEGEVLERPSMENFIRIIGDPSGNVFSADDIRELNHKGALIANILGNTYPYTEMLVFSPDSQTQSVNVSHWLKRCGMLGKIESHLVDDKASLTMPDGFYYEYSGTSWKSRPKLLGRFILSEGIPYREDMEFSITRRPDYRVPTDLLMKEYLAKTTKERAENYSAALGGYSHGAMKLDIDLLSSEVVSK